MTKDHQISNTLTEIDRNKARINKAMQIMLDGAVTESEECKAFVKRTCITSAEMEAA